MYKHRAKNLLARIEEPDLDGSLRPLSPAFVDESEQRQAAESELNEQSERAEKFAVALVFIAAGGVGRGRGRRRC